MSAPIKRVAIVGAGGRVGGAFAQALLEAGDHEITALTRHDGNTKLPDGIRIAKVDYDSEDSIAAALEGQQFLVITLAASAPEEVHARIVTAAGRAGVPYVMPNTFSTPIDPSRQPDMYTSSVISRIESVKATSSSPVLMTCGTWYEWSLGLGELAFGFDIRNRRAVFHDAGDRKITVSTWDQCGRALARLLALPESGPSPSLADYKGRDVLVNSFRVSQRDMLDSLHRVLGTTDADWEIRHEPSEKRIADGLEELGKGERAGFAKWLYATGFSPSNTVSDFAGSMETANGALGLPQEDLDEATKRTVDMVEGGWNPWGF